MDDLRRQIETTRLYKVNNFLDEYGRFSEHSFSKCSSEKLRKKEENEIYQQVEDLYDFYRKYPESGISTPEDKGLTMQQVVECFEEQKLLELRYITKVWKILPSLETITDEGREDLRAWFHMDNWPAFFSPTIILNIILYIIWFIWSSSKYGIEGFGDVAARVIAIIGIALILYIGEYLLYVIIASVRLAVLITKGANSINRFRQHNPVWLTIDELENAQLNYIYGETCLEDCKHRIAKRKWKILRNCLIALVIATGILWLAERDSIVKFCIGSIIIVVIVVKNYNVAVKDAKRKESEKLIDKGKQPQEKPESKK